MATTKLLEGIRVLCLEQLQVLPIGTSYLADLGADVLRVEHPDHLDLFRSSGPFIDNKPGEQWWNESGSWTFWNRNKKSIGLNVDTPSGKELFYYYAHLQRLRQHWAVQALRIPRQNHRWLLWTFLHQWIRGRACHSSERELDGSEGPKSILGGAPRPH